MKDPAAELIARFQLGAVEEVYIPSKGAFLGAALISGCMMLFAIILSLAIHQFGPQMVPWVLLALGILGGWCLLMYVSIQRIYVCTQGLLVLQRLKAPRSMLWEEIALINRSFVSRYVTKMVLNAYDGRSISLDVSDQLDYFSLALETKAAQYHFPVSWSQQRTYGV